MVGLRSLAPGEKDYKARYYGDLRARLGVRARNSCDVCRRQRDAHGADRPQEIARGEMAAAVKQDPSLASAMKPVGPQM